MERIILEENNLKDYTIIGRGYESIIYYYAGVVYKIFNKNILNSYLRIKSKIEKINFIHNNCFGFKIAYPEKLVFNAKNEFLGYTMQYINKKVDLYSFFTNYNTRLKDKIEMYILLEKMCLELAENGVYLIDNNFRNFAFTNQNEFIAVDIDSISTDEFRTEILPTYFFDYYNSRFNSKLDADFVKYTMALQFISNINNINREIIRYYDANNDIVLNQLLSTFSNYNLNEIKKFFTINNYERPFGIILQRNNN